jgi:hypothetical protein
LVSGGKRSKIDSILKVSIITSAPNQAKFIKGTIQSVQEQRYPNLKPITGEGALQARHGASEKIQKEIGWISGY